ncbi:pyridoxal phosphate-dependent aminotransferase [Mesorhizobium sp. ES1-4]|uniref:pyridoxal phosphate-dependent aminotransferase n=1 Tax=Mesorhizobium sp. ES1-4 TaxID=2876627 RepID=UPI001CCA8F8C|nr:pyridoxal phosphate-dependent aminotransferase [Mesorhizobium sp. ES1-4]MBZ9798436.1 pyridoxal phosphate-dependent aminotransferase [Mesorhizobium sp. ES1-4]
MSVLANRIRKVVPSATTAVTKRAAELTAEGRSIIRLSEGEPDFDTPEHIKSAAKSAIDAGLTKYTATDGTLALKKAIVEKFKREDGLSYSLDNIIVSTGAKQVIFNAFLATVDSGDEVIIPAPYWVSFPEMVRLAGGKPVIVECGEDVEFKLTVEKLRGALTSRTKWVIINNPNNPSGSCYSAEELHLLSEELLAWPDVFILSDDIYQHILFDGRTHETIVALEPALRQRTLLCNGVSKAYAMTGWRIGYGAGPKDLVAAMTTVQSHSTSNPNSIAQEAARVALSSPMEFLESQLSAYDERRTKCRDRLNAIDGLSCLNPGGAFYLFPSCRGLIGRRTPKGVEIDSDVSLATYFLEEAGVAVVPGSAFGLSPYFRISIGEPLERLEEACEAIAAACARLTPTQRIR